MSAEGVPVESTEDEVEVAILGENRKLDTEDDIADTVQAVRDHVSLTTLRLSGNSMGVKAAEAIAAALRARSGVRRALWSDMFVSRLKSEIPPALTALGGALITAQAQLVELNLSDNAFGPAGIEAVFPLLTSSVCFSLRSLKLNNTGMGITGGTLLSKALLQCHEEAEKVGCRLQLQVFVAGRNRLENEGTAALAEVFERIGTLLEVSLPQNGIHPPGIQVLAQALAKNQELTTIDLNDNTFTEEGSVAMAMVLPALQKLRSVNFGDCLVKSEGARAIATAMREGHQQLQEVYLGYNELDQGAGLAVAEAVANKTELKTLDLNGNCFGEGGIELLRESLEAKGKLEALGSLSDDEGEEEEEEDKEKEKEDKEEEEEEEEREALGSLSDDEGEEEEEGDTEKEDKEEEEEEEEEEEREVVEVAREQIPMTTSREAARQTEEQVSVNGTLATTAADVGGVLATMATSTADTNGILATAAADVCGFLAMPTAVGLLALGGHRGQLLAATLESPSPEDSARLYVKVASCYHANSSSEVKRAVGETLDAVVGPVCVAGHTSRLLNEILVQIGLIKSEDKEFQPVSEVEGPSLALTHLICQSYFPWQYRDILIFFIQKPNPHMDAIRHTILQALCT